MSGELQRDSRSLGDFRIVGRMGQKDAGAVAIQTDAVEHGRKMPVLSGIPVGDPDDLQTIRFHLLVAKHAHAGGRNCIQIFAVIAKLLVIAGDKVDSVGRSELAQGFCGTSRVDGCAVV